MEHDKRNDVVFGNIFLKSYYAGPYKILISCNLHNFPFEKGVAARMTHVFYDKPDCATQL